ILESLAKRALVKKIDHSWQDPAREGYPPGSHEGHCHIAGEARDNLPIKPYASGFFTLDVGQGCCRDGTRLNTRIGGSFRHYSPAMNARETWARNDALTGDAPMCALKIRPELKFVRPNRAKIDMAGLRRNWGKASVRVDERSNAQPCARPQDHLRALGLKL